MFYKLIKIIKVLLASIVCYFVHYMDDRFNSWRFKDVPRNRRTMTGLVEPSLSHLLARLAT